MIKGRRRRGTRMLLTTSLAITLTLLLALGTAGTASGLLPPDPIDPPPIEDLPEPPYVRPANGFKWSVPSRFGQLDSRGIVDYHWNSLEGPRKWEGPLETYDPSYVRPSSFPANFDGCPTASEKEKADADQPTDNTYIWTIASPAAAGGTETISRRACTLRYGDDPETAAREGWTAEGAYLVTLVIQNPDGTPFEGRTEPYEQTVRIKDFLIVSIGDSYASGEGNPDRPARVGRFEGIGLKVVFEPAVWQDRRCHRSAAAGPAQAAFDIEWRDPHSSVTFLSFACSGATIDTPDFGGRFPLDPYRPGDPTKPKGTGVLGSNLGAEPFNPEDYSERNKVPSQIAQLKNAVRSPSGSNRRIDALIVSGGGNDVGFAPIATVCTLYGNCREHLVWGALGEGLRPLQQRFEQDLATLRPKYDALDGALENPDNGFDIGEVYLTEYPDPTRNDGGAPCGEMLEDVVPWSMAPLLAIAAGLDTFFGRSFPPIPPYRMDRDEAEWASTVVLSGLNSGVRAATERHGWRYVDGVSAKFAGPGYGHGYCALDAWIRRASQSIALQGPWYDGLDGGAPDTGKTTGTLHPTTRGHRAYAERILEYLRPDLLGQPAQPSTPIEFTPSSQALGSTARTGDNGWLTGRCAAGVCTSDYAVAAVEATHPAGIRGVSLTVNGAPGCTAGVTCTTSTTTTNGAVTRYRWDFQFAADGVYRLEFMTSGADGASGTFSTEVKVDLHDPTGVSATTSATIEPSAGWYRVPVDVTLGGTDAGSGSGIAAVEHDLDGAGFVRGGDGEKITLAGDGVHSLTARSVDWAGRKSATQTITIQVDRTSPNVECGAADGAWHGANVSIVCTAADGRSGINGDSTFSLETSVPAGKETAHAETGSRQVCDVAGNCTTAGPISGNKIDRKAPSLLVPTGIVVNATSRAGALVTFGATATDGADPNPGVRCTPSSGSTFAAGVTTVICVAADFVGNSSQASFTVEVKGAAAQIIDLIEKTLAFMSLTPLEATLKAQLQTVVAAVAARPALACSLLAAYIVAVKAAPASAGLTAAEKAELVTDATRIRAVVGCV